MTFTEFIQSSLTCLITQMMYNHQEATAEKLIIDGAFDIKIFNGTHFFSIISSAALEISLKSSMGSCSKESYHQYAG